MVQNYVYLFRGSPVALSWEDGIMNDYPLWILLIIHWKDGVQNAPQWWSTTQAVHVLFGIDITIAACGAP